ncbi:MAG: mechanosensitive ion channel family protein [Deltaproteobacteria bacterium]|nr:mechanosensitive ion channel family protein [Deltaproteobacteria bacterium]
MPLSTELPPEYVALLALAVVFFSLVLGLLTRRVVLSRLARLAEKTQSRADDLFVSSISRPLPILFVLGGLYAFLRLIEPRPELQALAGKILSSVLIVTATLWATRLADRLLEHGATSPGAPATGVLRQTTRAVVVSVGGLVMLSTFGISVTPVLTTVGIGGIALALGVQETLSNLFAGMQITLAGNIRVGNFIKLESGDEGYVDDIRWRATRIRTLSNNVVIIPNGRLAQSVLTNYDCPSKDLAVLVQVGVHYSSDLDHVERVTCEIARKVMRGVPGAVPEFEPFVRFHTFAESSVDFTVIMRAKTFTDNYLIKHEFIKALARAYALEGIVIPFPIRAINLEQEKAFGARESVKLVEPGRFAPDQERRMG